MIQQARLLRDCRGSAAAEMALVLPILLVLLFGSVELGYYFMSEHVVDKAVRDASRYAARLPITDYPNCTSVDPTAELQIQRLARTGDPDGTIARLAGWTADNMTTVEIACDSDTSHIYVNKGLYGDFPNGGEVPVVTVTVAVPYNTLFGLLGLGATTLTLNASQQAAVIGA
jgi:Flp pilus assembly protein TadG